MNRAPVTLASPFPTPQFTELTGHGELAVAEAAASSLARPKKVTQVLHALISHLDHQPVTLDSFRQLSSAGREWLLQKAALLFFSGDWFETECQHCSARFDLQVSLRDIPKSKPAKEFPVVTINTSLGLRHFEAPNGTLEEALAVETHRDFRRVFAQVCGLSDCAEIESEQFTESDLAQLDQTLEQHSPDIADGLDVACPECNEVTFARIDPLLFAFPHWEDVLKEVHRLALGYHWTEQTILDLPLHRRKAYASLLRQTRRPS